MSVYDTIREGIAEDLRKASDYDRLKLQHADELAKALENPNKDVWLCGFHSGYEFCRRLYRGEKPLNENDEWERFRESRQYTRKESANDTD